MYCTNCGNQVDANAVACLNCGANPRAQRKYCGNCGSLAGEQAVVCTNCGVALSAGSLGGSRTMAPDQKEWLTTLLLCIFLGGLGVHRFYTGHTGIGLIQLFTGGGCGIWWIIDLISIVTGSYLDAQGKPLFKNK